MLNDLNIDSSAYELYADIKEVVIFVKPDGHIMGTEFCGDSQDTGDISRKLAKHFKETFSRDIRVHFVGAWCVRQPFSLYRFGPNTVDAK